MDIVNLFWFRRDLRLEDNAALYHALKSQAPILPIFIFDTDILHHLEDKTDARVSFLHDAIVTLNHQLNKIGSALNVYVGKPLEIFSKLLEQFNVAKVFSNRDYEAYGVQRDERIAALCQEKDIAFHQFKDQVIFEQNEVVKDDGKPYTVFTPYSKKWLAKLTPFFANAYPTEKYATNFYKGRAQSLPSLQDIGFTKSSLVIPTNKIDAEVVKHYSNDRDFPAKNGTSKLGIHLRFGTLSVRTLLRSALPLNATFVNEIIWRDFYHCITYHYPHISKGHSFKKEYDEIVWLNNEQEFERWCNGTTGYPIVDAGMRELNATGFMHNRVRMIVASFLTKHLLIDWRWGEAYFAKKLLDFDFAANNGGWQWAAGCGCDAAPYFRVFNPTLQTQKFDTNLEYVRKWVPEFEHLTYRPMVDHPSARQRCLAHYAKYLKK